MSCQHLLPIKSVSVAGVKRAYVPCGACIDCQEKNAFQWQFRLRAEWRGLSKRPERWSCAFATLTYGTKKGGYGRDQRPRLPRCLFKNDEDYKPFDAPLYCFNKRHCRQLLDNFKVWLYDNYGITKDLRYRYLLASEYGELTHRSHYHLLLFYPLVNGLTDEAVYDFLKNFWESRHGKMFPQHFKGGDKNKKGKVEKPFVVENKNGCIEKTIAYVSKYICKDIVFGDVVARSSVDTKRKLFKNYNCFHLQSKSLGSCFLDGLSHRDLHEIYFKGYAFVGDEKKRPIPVYLKNKIVYDNYYVHEIQPDGSIKRLVRKKASEFFIENAKEILEYKAGFIAKSFEQLNDSIFYKSHNISEDLIKQCTSIYSQVFDDHFYEQYDQKAHKSKFVKVRFTPNILALWYLSWFGRPWEYVTDVLPVTAYLSKYDEKALEQVMYSKRQPRQLVKLMNDCVNSLMAIIHMVGCDKLCDDDETLTFVKLIKEDLRDL